MTYAIVKAPEPRVFVADDDIVMSRVLAVQVVAATPARAFSDKAQLAAVREALLRQEWDVAVGTWIEATGTVVDVFPDEELWDEASLDAESALFEIRLAPIFAD